MKEEKEKRSGNTIVTSVSVSKEFFRLMEQYDLSPTECLRKGMAVTLHDLGVAQYVSPKNESRLKYVNEFLKRLDEEEDLKKKYLEAKRITVIHKNFQKIKKIIAEIEDQTPTNYHVDGTGGCGRALNQVYSNPPVSSGEENDNK